MKYTIYLSLLTLLPGLAAGAPVATAEQKAPIAIANGGPYYRLDLPVTIYATAANSDLSDVRVRNGVGSLVPHAWLTGTETETQVDSSPVPFFAVPVPARGKTQEDLTLVFKRTTAGTLVIPKTIKTDPERTTTDWIVDAGRVQGHFLQLRLTLEAQAEGLFPLRVEASDDLRHWRTVTGDAQIAVLRHGSERVEQLDVELHETRTRFLRLRWLDETLAPALTAVTLDSVRHHEAVPPLQWSAPIPASCGENYCDYAVPARMPLESLRVHLAEPNTLARIAVSGFAPVGAIPNAPHRHNPLYVLRHKRHAASTSAESGESMIAASVAYRLEQGRGEVRSQDIALDGRVYQRLRLRTDGPIAQLGKPPPAITIAAAPRSLVFLGQGGGPFTLHWGVHEPHGRAAPLSLIAPGYRPGQRDFAALARVDIPAPPPEEKPVAVDVAKEPEPVPAMNRKIWLWGALAAGLLVLAAMAWSLFRGMEGKR